MDKEIWKKPLQSLKMIGPRRSKVLEKLDIYCLGDLLYHFPREYEDRRKVGRIHNFRQGDNAVVKGTVLGVETLRPRKGLSVTKAGLHDGMSVFYAVWFNQPYIKKQLHSGRQMVVCGKLDKSYGAPQVKVNDYDTVSGAEELVNTGRIVPIYPLTSKLGQRALRQMIFNVLGEILPGFEEFLPQDILKRYALPGIKEAMSGIHFPSTPDQVNEARRRFIFEELFMLQTELALRRLKNTSCKKQHRYYGDDGLTEDFIRRLPFPLTGAQERVWKEIDEDLGSPYPMNRLLQGDVGSGKTIISALALLKAAESGLQGVLMVPTEILAEQHFFNLSPYMEKMGVRIALITGGMPEKDKESVLNLISSGTIRIVVGTHALIEENVHFANLSLVVVDEQHRFGVRQRATLLDKGSMPDVLVMTATPIPRTLAMTSYGDLEISTINEMPPGRRPVETLAVKPSALGKVYKLLEREMKAGRQAYIVCALVDESDKVDIRPAVEMAAYFRDEVFRGYNVGLLHGRMTAREKQQVMESFRDREIHLLVSTSVIEVGVDVPGATVMVILDAHRFGLAQLHQLRGRVGRGGAKSYCVLVAEPVTDEARERLRAMTMTNDGFQLAETDLKIRGPGEFFGTRQSGMPELKVARFPGDFDLLKTARREVEGIFKHDPSLGDPDHKKLYLELQRRLNKKGNFVNIG